MNRSAAVNRFISLLRPYNASATVLTLLVGYFFDPAARFTWQILIGVLIVLCIHSLATLQNDVYDMVVDRTNKRKGALLDGSLSLANATLTIEALAAAAIVLALIGHASWLHLFVVLGMLGLAWAYNAPPLQLSRRPILSILTLGLSYGLLPFAYGYLLGPGPLDMLVVLLAGSWFVQRVSISLLKDYKDVTGDRAHNKRTFLLRYGPAATARLSIALCALAYTVTLVLLFAFRPNGLLFWPFLLVSTALMARNIRYRLELVPSDNNKERNVLFHKSFFGENQFEMVVLLWLILS